MQRHPNWLSFLLLAAAGAAQAQGFSLEGAVIDSRNSQNLGVVSESGQIAGLFRAQKAMTFGILRSAGISMDQLPPEVRARVERFQTSNVEAFRAFSQGLDLKDQGKFAEAKEFFRRAAELDPNFALASEQQRSMPDVTLGNSVQTRALVAAAAGAAVDRGKAGVAIDAARAAAAMAAGITVYVGPAPATEQAQNTGNTGNGYTSNPPGSGQQFVPHEVVGLSYGYTQQGTPLMVASVNEWKGDSYKIAPASTATGNLATLDSVGTAGDFQALRGSAPAGLLGSATLQDGTVAYWGSWLGNGKDPGIQLKGSKSYNYQPSQVDYVMAEAPRAMPTTSRDLSFTPAGGSLAQVSGTVTVNFGSGQVTLNSLGFSIGSLQFSGLAGSANYFDPKTAASLTASGAFQGNYSAGNCVGCAGFSPQASTFGGNFVGSKADGLVFSTILNTGSNLVSGVHLFKQ